MYRKFMYWFKGTSLYYWLVLVFWQAIVEFPRKPFVWDKIMDTILGLISYFIIFGLVYYGVIQTSLTDYFDVTPTASKMSFLFYVLILLVISRFLQNLLSIPPRIYSEVRKKQDRFTWDYVSVEMYEFTDGGFFSKSLRGVGFRIKNEKPFYYGIHFKLPYLEIDEKRSVEEYRVTQSENSRRLIWYESPHPSSASVYAEKETELKFLLFHLGKPNSISYWEYDQDSNGMRRKEDTVNYNVKGSLLIVFTGVDSGQMAQEYHFEISIDKYGKIRYSLNEGRIRTYDSIKG